MEQHEVRLIAVPSFLSLFACQKMHRKPKPHGTVLHPRLKWEGSRRNAYPDVVADVVVHEPFTRYLHDLEHGVRPCDELAQDAVTLCADATGFQVAHAVFPPQPHGLTGSVLSVKPVLALLRNFQNQPCDQTCVLRAQGRRDLRRVLCGRERRYSQNEPSSCRTTSAAILATSAVGRVQKWFSAT